MKFNLFKKKKQRYIAERSNVIQYDTMGYPLRFVVMSDNSQQWLDTVEEDGDIVLGWNKVAE